MHKVEIYSTATCHYCHLTKDFFSAHNVPFTDYNVGVDTTRRAEAVQKSGQMGVPVIVVDGTNVVVGFDQDRLSSLLEIA